jgi:hypothetical protein
MVAWIDRQGRRSQGGQWFRKGAGGVAASEFVGLANVHEDGAAAPDAFGNFGRL